MQVTVRKCQIKLQSTENRLYRCVVKKSVLLCIGSPYVQENVHVSAEHYGQVDLYCCGAAAAAVNTMSLLDCIIVRMSWTTD